jgi:hypothetical protein
MKKIPVDIYQKKITKYRNEVFFFYQNVKFRERYLCSHVFLNEVVRVGIVHGKLRLGAQKMSISTIPHNHIIWVT